MPVKLAHLLVTRVQPPAQALKVLAKFSDSALSETQQKTELAIRRRAETLVVQGVLEVKTDDV